MKARFLAAIIVVLMITVGCSARKLVTPGNQTGRVFSKKITKTIDAQYLIYLPCLLYTSPSPRDLSTSRMPSSA